MTLDLPVCLTRATSVSWTMDANHGLAESPWSGHVQAQRGAMERWKFTMNVRRMSPADAAEAAAFFMRLEGRLNTFRMGDPSCPYPRGRATGHPVLAVAGAAGDRTLSTSGWTGNVPLILAAGDWIQIGDQLTRVRANVASSPAGTATLEIWPKLYLPFEAGTPIITRRPVGIFRFVTDLPSWTADAAESIRPWQFSLTGSQEILT